MIEVASLPEKADAWVAFHIFYPASPRPLLIDGVRKIVQDLRETGLIDGYFFINYWLEGGHVRLRLRPSDAAARKLVLTKTAAALSSFLSLRPALYDYDIRPLQQMYDAMFMQEFTAEERDKKYQGSTQMPIRAGNSFEQFPYEPEYAKYGGPAGIQLAERHFEFSSDLVLDLLQSTNTHMRTVLLGTSVQLMYVMIATFLPPQAQRRRFLLDYHEFWARSAEAAAPGSKALMTARHEVVGDKLSDQLDVIDRMIAIGDPSDDSTLGRWVAHCKELAGEVRQLATSGKLVFPNRDDWATDGSSLVRSERLDFVADPDSALGMLLFPFVHMTNNRLSTTLIDEAYLSQLLLMTHDARTASEA